MSRDPSRALGGDELVWISLVDQHQTFKATGRSVHQPAPMAVRPAGLPRFYCYGRGTNPSETWWFSSYCGRLRGSTWAVLPVVKLRGSGLFRAPAKD